MQTSTGLSLWWFQNPGIVGVIHLGWAAAMLALVFLAPQWLVARGASGDARGERARAPAPPGTAETAVS